MGLLAWRHWQLENFHNGANARDSNTTALDNSHYATETLVRASTVQPTLVQLFPVHVLPITGKPSTSGRLLDEGFASFTFGDIRTSAAQITTCRIIVEPEPATISPLSSPAVLEKQLLHCRQRVRFVFNTKLQNRWQRWLRPKRE